MCTSLLSNLFRLTVFAALVYHDITVEAGGFLTRVLLRFLLGEVALVFALAWCAFALYRYARALLWLLLLHLPIFSFIVQAVLFHLCLETSYVNRILSCFMIIVLCSIVRPWLRGPKHHHSGCYGPEHPRRRRAGLCGPSAVLNAGNVLGVVDWTPS